MIVTFCGHRNVSDNAIITDRLTDAITNLFLEATTDNVPISFYCGGYGEFDRLAENSLREDICYTLYYTVISISKRTNETAVQRYYLSSD